MVGILEGRVTALLEHLTDVGDLEAASAYLRLGTWSEPPLYTAYSHIAMLADLGREDRDRVLVAAALVHADRIVSAAATLDAEQRRKFVCLITLMDWAQDEPIYPSFLVSANARVEFAGMKLAQCATVEATRATQWLREVERASEFLVMDSARGEEDPTLQRVYIGHEMLPGADMLTINSFASSE